MFLRRSALLSSLLFFLGSILAPIASAQITNVTNSTTTPTPGSGHDYIKMVDETVNPANGSVSIRVETPVPQGRGLTIPFTFDYDSNGAHILRGSVAGGSAGFLSNTTFLSQNGWSYGVPLLSANFIHKTESLPNGNTISCEIDKDYVFQDPAGGRHALHLAATQQSQISQCKEGPVNPGGDDFVSAFHGNCFGTNCNVHVADADGTVYTFDGPLDHLSGFNQSGASLPTTIEDRNGNKVVVTTNASGVTTFTDTAGRAAFSFSNFGASGSTVSVSGLPTNYTVTWGTATMSFSVNPIVVPNTTNPQCNPISNASGTNPVITAIELQNSKSYQFDYSTNPYGLLGQITYPTGGWVRYVWALNAQSEVGTYADAQGHANSCAYSYDWPAVQHRTVSFDGTNTALVQDFSYSIVWNSSHTAWTSKKTIVTTHDCARNNFNCTGAPSFTVTYTYLPVTPPLPPYDTETFGSQVPVESTIVTQDFTGATLQTVNKTWFDQYEMTCASTTLPNGQISRTDYAYGQGVVTTDKKDWDWGQAPACGGTPSGTPKRETVTKIQTFANTPIYTNGTSSPSIFDRPSSVVINGAGTKIAETDYAYDEPSHTIAPVTATSHDDTHYPSTVQAPRGNVTTLTKLCFSCTNAVTSFTYDETGQVATVTDSSNHTTTYSYSDSSASCGGTAGPSGNTNAYLTSVTNALGQVQSYCYGYNDGQLRGSTDANNRTTKYKYGIALPGCIADDLDRLDEADFPDGGSTKYCYNDSSYNATNLTPSVITTRALNASANLTTLTVFDGVGHILRTVRTPDPDCSIGDRTDTVYDGTGHIHSVSNPYCSTTEPTPGITTYLYDSLGRTTQVTDQDNSTILTTYTNRAAQVQDEGNGTQRVTRISQIDGLGRLVSVCEVAPGPFVGAGGASSASLIGSGGTPATCSLDIAGTGFLTSYQYDALDNLTQVSQSGFATRSFTYDSLSRLVTASNPESGGTTYTYDSDPLCASPNSFTGDLVSKVDARNVRTCFQYDALHRLTEKTYAGGTVTTLPAIFAYDQSLITMGSQQFSIANSIGRLSLSCSLTPSGFCNGDSTANSYDAMGRVVKMWQENPVNNNSIFVAYTYDYLGNETDRNLSGNDYTSTYNTAGRLSTFNATNFTNATNPPNLLAGAHYDAAGHLVSATLASGLTESWGYDKRERLQAGAVGTSCSNGSCTGSTAYAFSLTFAPNGNVLTANDTVNGNWMYGYDAFNRLTCSNLTSNGTCATPTSGKPTFSYVYDRFGNRWQQNNGPSTFMATFSGNNNRMDTFLYDAAGNLLKDQALNTYVYDAENRIVSVTSMMSGTTTYAYNPKGQRVSKTNGSTTTDFIYDRGGHVILTNPDNPTFIEMYVAGMHLGTYDVNSAQTASIFYYDHADWLGTERARTNLSGVACETTTSFPFGDGQGVSASCGQPVSPRRFTGKERDAESGLDNFGARYDSSSMGRFMSADSTANVKPTNPQDWNLYAYSRNNPLLYVDPTGNTVSLANCKDKRRCVQVLTNAAQLPNGVTAEVDKNGNLALKGDLSKIKGGNAARLLQLVRSDKTANFWIGDNAPGSDRGQTQPVGGGLSHTTSQGYNQNYSVVQSDPSTVDSGDLSTGLYLSADGTFGHNGPIPGADIDETAAHELLGHVWADLVGGQTAGTDGNKREALIAEDRVRNTDPARGLKIYHQREGVDLIRPQDLPRITSPGDKP